MSVLNTMVVRLVADTKGLKTGLAMAQRDVAAFSKAGKTNIASMKRMGAASTKYVTLPLLALGAVSGKVAADFEDAMTKSTAIMGEEGKRFRTEMERVAKDVATQTTFSAKEAAESYYYLASAGLSAEQSMGALPQVAKFAQAGAFDMAKATDLLTDAQSALGLTVDDTEQNMKNMARTSDVLVKANVLSNATVEQFSTSLTNKGGAALKLLNKDVEEGVALLAAWADQGVKGEEAGTYLHMMLRDLQRAAIREADVWEEMGIATYDAAGKMRRIPDIIRDLNKALQGMSDREKKVALESLGFQDRSSGVIISVLDKADAIDTYERKLREAGGTTEEVSKNQLGSLKSQAKVLKNTFEAFAIDIGQLLIPMVKGLVKVFGGVARFLNKLPDGFKKLAVGIGIAAAAFGPLLVMTAKLVSAWRVIRMGKTVSALTGMADSTCRMSKCAGRGATNYGKLSKAAGKAGGGAAVAKGAAAAGTGMSRAAMLAGGAGFGTYVTGGLFGLAALTQHFDPEGQVKLSKRAAKTTSQSASGGKTPGGTQLTAQRVSQTKENLKKAAQVTPKLHVDARKSYEDSRKWGKQIGEGLTKALRDAPPKAERLKIQQEAMQGAYDTVTTFFASNPVTIDIVADPKFQAADRAARNALKPGRGGIIPWHAAGADYIATRPMVFGAGERGPERVQVTPLNGVRPKRAERGGQVVHEHKTVVNITGVPGRRQLEQLKRDLAAAKVGVY